ncbi:MAG TPA: cytidine deaminase [Candidatus Sulfomarinibacteraceae bacterium]|nr:cytidine deaminase [Candidatus Sulfomarinibacteraceae bacterium]
MTITKDQRVQLEQAACESRSRAYAPYSKFQVGAAVLAESGAIYSGVNVENASYGLTTCAERVAIFQAVAAGERRILAVAVCTESGVTPCGPCRQVMREFATDLPIFILDKEGRSRQTSLSELLPDSFGSEHLEDQ